MADTITKGKDKDGTEIIDLMQKVTVYATGIAPHHTEGDEITVHPKVAEQFIKNGFATESKDGKKTKKGE